MKILIHSPIIFFCFKSEGVQTWRKPHQNTSLAKSDVVYISMITTTYPLEFKCLRFPVKLRDAMTIINIAQGH